MCIGYMCVWVYVCVFRMWEMISSATGRLTGSVPGAGWSEEVGLCVYRVYVCVGVCMCI